MTDINAPGFVNAIGNTPLIKLHGVSGLTGCNIFGKAEFMNPGGSVKDRAAKAIVEDAEDRGGYAALIYDLFQPLHIKTRVIMFATLNGWQQS